MDTKAVIDQLVEQVGFDFVGECTTEGFRTQPEVRNMCAANLCQHYDKSWSCPPACGDIEEYEQRMRAFDQCVVVQSVGQMEDPYDIETVMETATTQDDRFRGLVKQLQEQDFAFMALGAGACMLCKTCTYPDAPCRFPDKMYPCVESHAIIVTDIAEQYGIEFISGNVVTWFSILFYRDK